MAAAGLVLTSCGKDSPPPHPQPWEQYETAIKHLSTAPYFVLVTIVDGRSGVARTDCIPANLLLGAIHREHRLPKELSSIPRAEKIALSQKDRRFVFNNPEALANVTANGAEARAMSRRACEIIRSGQPAYMADISGEVVAGSHDDE